MASSSPSLLALAVSLLLPGPLLVPPAGLVIPRIQQCLHRPGQRPRRSVASVCTLCRTREQQLSVLPLPRLLPVLLQQQPSQRRPSQQQSSQRQLSRRRPSQWQLSRQRPSQRQSSLPQQCLSWTFLYTVCRWHCASEAASSAKRGRTCPTLLTL